MKLKHLPTGIEGTFIREYKPTGHNWTTQIMTAKGIYFAPSCEFEKINVMNETLHLGVICDELIMTK